MRRRNLLIVIVVCCAAATWAPLFAKDYPLEWHWINVRPNDEAGWSVANGTADVAFKGSTFNASLNGGTIILKGTISGNHVVATETVIDTDMSPFILRGNIQRSRTRLSDASSGWGSDRISLFSRGGFYLALFRKVRSGAPPGK
jgi:hypothetical protein